MAAMRRRWPILALLVWLPLVKWVLPPGDFRWALFYGGGTVLAAYAIRRAGDWPRLRALFAQPWRGMADGLTVYLTLMVLSLAALYAPILGPVLPYAAYDLAALFDPLPVYVAFKRGDGFPPGGTVLLVMLGAIAEEWIFRATLLWRWIPPGVREIAQPWRRLMHPAAAWRILAVSLGFAALHWPQPPALLLVAFLGSLVLGVLLVWRPSFLLVALLHVLFNVRALI